MMSHKLTVPKQVLVLHKTLDILETLKKDGSGMGLAEVARSVSMPKATVYRILATLETRGYLDRRSPAIPIDFPRRCLETRRHL